VAAAPRSAYVAAMTRVLILGAGHAGGAAAATLRQFGHEGPILLVGEEPHLPYQRPPLSKAWLKGEAGPEDLFLRPETFYAEQGVEVRLGMRAEAIDADARTVAFADGSTEPFDVLILATGSVSRALPLPGADLPGVLALRSMAEAEALKARLTPGARLVVIGGGFVGLEAAASARALGCEAVVLERAPRLLSRVASEPVSDLLAARHRAEGVVVHTDVEISAITPDGERLRVVHAGGAETGDVVLVGVGADACDALARSAGLACDGGVVVDGQARTSHPAIFAIGDCTRRPVLALGEGLFRLESVPNALEQAKQAAAAITGRTPPPAEVPWFWSDQYDLKLQMAGLPAGADRTVVRGDPAAGPLAVFHLKGDRLVCVEAINAPAEFMGGRQLIARATPVDPAKLADPAVSMKAVAL
jgi:3-phenylpropionate/trans-cinnamate dioxygenase ferredoxin reductase subunit